MPEEVHFYSEGDTPDLAASKFSEWIKNVGARGGRVIGMLAVTEDQAQQLFGSETGDDNGIAFVAEIPQTHT